MKRAKTSRDEFLATVEAIINELPSPMEVPTSDAELARLVESGEGRWFA